MSKDSEGLSRHPPSLRFSARMRAWGRVAGGARACGGAGAGLREAQLARNGALGIETRPFAAAGDVWADPWKSMAERMVSRTMEQVPGGLAHMWRGAVEAFRGLFPCEPRVSFCFIVCHSSYVLHRVGIDSIKDLVTADATAAAAYFCHMSFLRSSQ